MRHRHTVVLGVLAFASAAGGLACGGDEPARQQAVFWLGFATGPGASCSSAITINLPDDTARATITGLDGRGERLEDAGDDLVQCSVSPSSTAGSYDLSLRLSSGIIGDFVASGVVTDTAGTVDVDVQTSAFSLGQDDCTVEVEKVLAGAVWLRSLRCTNLRDPSSPAIQCIGNGGMIFENCSK